MNRMSVKTDFFKLKKIFFGVRCGNMSHILYCFFIFKQSQIWYFGNRFLLLLFLPTPPTPSLTKTEPSNSFYSKAGNPARWKKKYY